MNTERLELLESIRTLAYYYNNYIYEGKADCLSVEYFSNMKRKAVAEVMQRYFIDRVWENGEVFRSLDMIGKDGLLQLVESVSHIQAITVDDNGCLISFKYPFIFSKEALCKAYNMLKDGYLDQFKVTYPTATQKVIFEEINNLNNILMHCSRLIDINVI
jgi:hypothetical protein